MARVPIRDHDVTRTNGANEFTFDERVTIAEPGKDQVFTPDAGIEQFDRAPNAEIK